MFVEMKWRVGVGGWGTKHKDLPWNRWILERATLTCLHENRICQTLICRLQWLELKKKKKDFISEGLPKRQPAVIGTEKFSQSSGHTFGEGVKSKRTPLTIPIWYSYTGPDENLGWSRTGGSPPDTQIQASQRKVLVIFFKIWALPCGTVDKNPPANAGDMGSNPGPGISHSAEQLRLCTTTTEPKLESLQVATTENPCA